MISLNPSSSGYVLVLGSITYDLGTLGVNNLLLDFRRFGTRALSEPGIYSTSDLLAFRGSWFCLSQSKSDSTCWRIFQLNNNSYDYAAQEWEEGQLSIGRHSRALLPEPLAQYLFFRTQQVLGATF